jgi:MFS family permease
VSVVFGPVLGSIFFFSYRFELLLACLVVSIILAIVLAKYIRETVPVKKEILESVGADKKWHEAVWEQLKDYRVIASDKLFLMFVLAGILVAQTFMQMDLLLAVYTTEKVPEQTLLAFGNWNLSLTGEKVFGYLISLNGLLVALCTVWIAKWMNRFREGRVFILSTILYGISMLVFGGTTIMWVLFGAMVIFTTAELMVVGIQESFISKLAPENMRGQYFAAAGLRFSIGRTIAPISVPLTMWIGFHNTFYLLFILAIIGAGIYYIMFRAFEKKNEISSKVSTKQVVS